jgi:hypothetical protein
MPHNAANPSPDNVDARLNALLDAVVNFVPMERGKALAQKWLSRLERADLSRADFMNMTADAVVLAGDLLVSQPSFSGATAFDRLARSPAGRNSDPVLLAALRQARFRLLAVRDNVTSVGVAEDVMTGEIVCLNGLDLPPFVEKTTLFGRVAALPGGELRFAGAITPLDPAALVLALGHPAAGAQNPAAASRWAEAIYAHVVRNGTLEIPGLNRPDFDEDEGDDDEMDAFIGPELAALRDLSMAWLDLEGAAPDADLIRRTRQSADVPTILDSLAACILSRDATRPDIAETFERMLLIQLETVHRRERGGATGVTLASVAAALAEASKSRGWPERVTTLFENLRRRVTGGHAAEIPELERLVQRIQALRAKTVEQGCTEQEALAAAEKVAELLDRHGLSLNELEFKAQPCEGVGIQTTRRRTGPIDACIPAIAGYFDCRVWAENAPGAPLRYIFFGLRGDVAAAQYLYEMVERAFTTETDAFRRGDLYLAMEGERRSATNSFQIGLGGGISQKLRSMREARDTARRSASGRDLVPMKAAMVDDEMAKLGLSLSPRMIGGARRVLADAYEAGQQAGERFEVTPAITRAA